ncbi:MAG: hypothetical protein H6745_14925 [Deltaproteobacteria bacterium]|nr:hypothetical protein [Deltaproteobacteria bacterium]
MRGERAFIAATVGLLMGALGLGCGGDGGSGDGSEKDAASDTSVDTTPPVDPQCVGVSIGTACDDGDPCTSGDKCVDQRCVGAVVKCDDGDVCTDDRCDAELGCVHANNTATCDDGDQCTVTDKCQAGACVGKPASDVTCNDGDPCTLGDVCTAGTCAGTPNACDDGDPCTADSCDIHAEGATPGTGCLHVPTTGPCDDGNPCTKLDMCGDGGVCAGTPATGATCSDGDYCTSGETCQDDGTCGGGQAVTCDDHNGCTDDQCDAGVGCRFVAARGRACDDGDACTVEDACDSDGACVGADKDCDPHDLCLAGRCEAGQCVTEAVTCDDHNPCTDDSCDPAVGCRHVANTNTCNDGNACTLNDRCDATQCLGTPVTCDTSQDNACQQNLCDTTTGQCRVITHDGTLCNDGVLCTNSDVCSGGRCVGIPVNCQDGDPCTENWCEEATGICKSSALSEEECDDLAHDRTNQYRNLMSLPLIDNHEAIIQAATAHCEFYVNNEAAYAGGLSPHAEPDGATGSTGASFGQRMQAAGYTGSPMFEVMAFINDPVRSVDEWMATLYHRIPFVVPRTLEMGYGAAEANGRRCDTIDFGDSPSTPNPDWDGLIVPFPLDGMSGVPTWWDGAENPQPPLPNAYPSGPILTVTFARPSGYPNVKLTDSDIQGPSGPVAHVANDESTDSDLCCGVVTLYPLAPLQAFTTYTVVVQYTKDGTPGTFQWSFTTNNGSMNAESQYYLP